MGLQAGTHSHGDDIETGRSDSIIEMDSLRRHSGYLEYQSGPSPCPSPTVETSFIPPTRISKDGEYRHHKSEISLGSRTNTTGACVSVADVPQPDPLSWCPRLQSADISACLEQDIDTDHWLTDLSLLLICFSSAVERLVTKWDFIYQIFGLTGNLGELMAPQSPFRLSLALAVIFWAVGIVIAGQIANRLRVKTCRWWLLTTMTSQFVLILIALVTPGYPLQSTTADEDTSLLIKVSLLAASSGMTFTMIKQVKIPEINAALMTGVVGNFLACDRLFAKPVLDLDRSRVRFLLCFATFCAGYKIAHAMKEARGLDDCWIWSLVLLPRALAILVLFFIRGNGDSALKPAKICV